MERARLVLRGSMARVVRRHAQHRASAATKVLLAMALAHLARLPTFMARDVNRHVLRTA